MGRISSGIGLISGINSQQIIEQLMKLEARPKTVLQSRIDQANKQKLAYTDLSTRLTALKLSATTLKKTSTFETSNALSSNPDAISATAASGSAKGTFQFQVARLVTSQQSVSRGMADSTTTPVASGSRTITIEMGGGEVYSQTPLSQLNGGEGVRQGSFRITDRSGRSTLIDTSGAFTLDDVVRRINTNIDVSVRADIDGDRLVLTDLSGGSSSNLIVADLGAGSTAADLGIAGSVAGNTLTGGTINYLGRNTSVADLNDGLGVRTAKGPADFRITARDGSSYDVSVNGLTSVGAILDAINAATGGQVTATIAAQSKGIQLIDTTGGGGDLSVTALNNSRAALDLGIEQTVPGDQIQSRDLIASVNSVLLTSLRGGQGLNLGRVSITDRAGNSATVDLSGARSLQDIIRLISDEGGINVTARIRQSGNGIEIIDNNAGAVGNLLIADVDSTTAAELGLAGTFTPADAVARGANLQRRWVNENTLLSNYNGGNGVSTGTFKITNSLGASATVEITSSDLTLADAIAKINAKGIGVTASINPNGDGLLLTDTAGGGQALKVADVSGKAAADLAIAGSAPTGMTTIDGTFERSITLDATDTLQTAVDKINAPGFAVRATIVNDGSPAAPYRLSLTARNTGRNGRFIFDAADTLLQTSNLVEAQDAAVFYGQAGTQRPLLITSSKNQLTGVVRGLTLDLHAVTSSPVSITVSDNVDAAVRELNKFAESFNGIVAKIAELTAYDSEAQKRGLLLGDGTIQRIQERLYVLVSTRVKEAGTFKGLSDIGISISRDAKVEFDENKFRSAYATDPQGVKTLFTLFAPPSGTTPARKGLGTVLEEGINSLVDPVNGVITRQNQSLEKRTDQFQERMAQMDKLLDAKRTRLERQFASMETVLANLQAQQQSLAGFQPVSSLTSTRKS